MSSPVGGASVVMDGRRETVAQTKTSDLLMRSVDIVLATIGLICLSPLLIGAMIAIWWQDGYSPFYVSKRVGRDGRLFNMVKLRSMIKNADKTGVASTSANDNRITRVGHFVRRSKLDEIPQLWNVIRGDMSLVGPRPNVQVGVALYTAEERRLLSVRPGITDLSSIVFSDEGEILKGSLNPDLLYEQIIRPWKSRLGLVYVQNRSLLLNLKLIALTALAIVDKQAALRGVNRILSALQVDPVVVRVSRRDADLYPFPPPGAADIVRAI
jgi:lipopolysaccharide/colanic/teichoic acid biosynthesis glycosyltransferase